MLQKQKLRDFGWPLIVMILVAAIFAVDLVAPQGQNHWLLYIGVVGLTLFSPLAWLNLLAAGLSTIFLVVGHFFYYGVLSGAVLQTNILNRFLGLVTLWVVAFAVYRFKKFEAQIQKDSWQRALEAELAEALAKELELKDLAHAVIEFFVKYCEALVGTYYITENKKQLNLIRSIGGTNIPEEVEVGEGLTGQYFLKNEIKVVNDLPADFLQVSSATGRGHASHVLFIPMKYGNSNRGIIEIGSHHPFSAEIIEFANEARDMLGQALASSLYARDLKKALSEKSQQAEELQAQQEELRVTNEELEAQSAALKDSQAQLETQTAELEQQQVLMEEKNEELKGRNDELHRIKRELEGSARELSEANKYKSEFLSNMSHELRTPINSMLILSQLLAENKGQRLSSEEVEFAKTITTSGNDLLNLINEILDLSKVEAGMMDLHVEKFRPTDVTERMRRFFSPICVEKGIDFEIDSSELKEDLIESDQKRLEQILKNLISNAIKFTSEGRVQLKVFADNKGGLSFEVNDTGIGIPESKKLSIFRAFEQGDGTIVRRFGGTGLGLSIVKELTHLLQGQITLESEVGRGSRFRLELPTRIEQKTSSEKMRDVGKLISVASKKDEVPSANLKTAEIPSGLKVTLPFSDDRENIEDSDRVVAILEDDPVFAKTLLKIAREMDFKGISSATGSEGLELIERFKPSAVLLDMRLADTNGLTVLEHIKSTPHLRHIPVHVVSAVSYEQNALAMGAIGYLQKPTSADEIRGAFKRVEGIMSKEVKHVLIVEDDPIQREALQKLVASPEVKTTAVGRAKEALEVLGTESLDCLIIDLRLPDATGLELLKQISELEEIEKPPVIVYTGKDLSRDEEMQLKKYSESIIIKGARSPERLLAETTLFLHRVERELPHEKQKMLREVRERSDALQGRTILLVDDDVRNVFALSAALEGQGLKVIAARNGREAIEKLHDNEKIEAILMDIMMPEMDGFEAMRRIRAEEVYKSLPIIALTAKAMKGDDIRCLEAGANDYLSKPVDLDKLLSLLRVWLSSVSGF